MQYVVSRRPATGPQSGPFSCLQLVRHQGRGRPREVVSGALAFFFFLHYSTICLHLAGSNPSQ